ncbi:MAG: DUF4177 domain-containing protein [Flavobacteriaceae bacterium]|nr:DUF4177 domain-containing protein [Flavobacteriaceae bacterium]
MKEYKIIEKGFWKKNSDLEDTINRHAREGWEVKSAIGDGHGNFSRVILERDKYR